MYICENDQYCRAATMFESVEEFLEMVQVCFGVRLNLREQLDGAVVDNKGEIVLREVSA